MAIPPRPQSMAAAVYDKITADDLSVAIKIELLLACTPCTTEDAVAFEFNEFALGRRFQGSRVSLIGGEVVGNIRNLINAARYIANEIHMDVTDVEIYFRQLSGAGTRRQQQEAEFWFRNDVIDHVPDLRISPTPSWLFRQPVSTNVRTEYDAPTAECLPCRLGLPEFIDHEPYPRGIEFIGYCITDAALGDCRQPTCLDGNYNSVKGVWVNGGLTQPIQNGPPDCVSRGGFPELVSNPPFLRDIQLPTALFRN